MLSRSQEPRPRLLGRQHESDVLQRALRDAKEGRSRVLVVRGEAGVGKSSLLEALANSAEGCQVARVVGIESEMELAFAGLHQLCASMLGQLGRLPEPQRHALSIAFGLSSGPPPDRFLVGLAVLSLLAEVAEDAPVLCIVDDAHWLDDVSGLTLAFAARRLLAERVAFVFAVRAPDHGALLAGLPELLVPGLSTADARQLLSSVVAGPLDEQVVTRLVAETRGNPLALLQLSSGLTPAELAGGFGLPGVMPIATRLEESFVRRLEPLPALTRTFLLTAAVEPTGDAALLRRALDELGVPADATAPAEAAGLVELGVRVRFSHPVVRSAVYRAAAPEAVREAHRALAAATDPQVDADRRAWHRAQATPEADEAVAAELEHSAGRARNRGGAAAAAAFLERAADLSPDAAQRGRRAIAAAQDMYFTADYAKVRELLEIAATCPLDPHTRAWGERLRGQLAQISGPANEAATILLAAAAQLAPLDWDLARSAYLDAFASALYAGRLGDAHTMHWVARAADDARPPHESPNPLDLLLDGLTTRFARGYEAGLLPLRRSLAACGAAAHTAEQQDLPGTITASAVPPELWDDEAWEVLTSGAVLAARSRGALNALPVALNYRAAALLQSGRFAEAAALIEEADAISDASGHQAVMLASFELTAWRGREAETLRMIDRMTRVARTVRFGRPISLGHYSKAILYNGLGRYPEALTAAQQACEHEDLDLYGRSLVELVEAGVRSGKVDLASDALERLVERTALAGTDWARGIEARSRALLTDGPAAEALYVEAIDRLTRTRIRAELARGHLLYGEWLRREGRRTDAREQLRPAHEMLTGMGAEAFGERARRELMATGETVRKRRVDTRNELTAQEAQIARLAADGHTNPEIGAQLFVSPRTVEWHLRKVYTKLDISSRRELRRALAGMPGGHATS